MLRWVRRRFPSTDDYEGTKLTVKRDGQRLITPMLIVIIALGSTDLLFALDSIPAIYGLTQEPYLVFTANVFALMGLRQLYFLLGGLLRRLVYLSIGLSVILAFIGIKLVFHAMHEYHLDERLGIPFSLEIPIWLSLTFIIVTLTITTVASLVKSRYDADNAPPTGRGQRRGAEVGGRHAGDRTPSRLGAAPLAWLVARRTADSPQRSAADPAAVGSFCVGDRRSGGQRSPWPAAAGSIAAVTSSATSVLSTTSTASSTSAGTSSRSGSLRLRQEHRGQPGPLGGEQLLLGPADRQHPPVQGDLAGHPDVGADRPAQRHRGQRRHHGDAGRRPVLGHGPGGHVDVDVPVEDRAVGDPQQVGVRPDVRPGDLRRLLHHVAQLTGQGQARADARPTARRPR